MNETNCFNSSDIGFSDVYTITTKAIGGNATSDAHSLSFRRSRHFSAWHYLGWAPVVLGGLWVLL